MMDPLDILSLPLEVRPLNRRRSASGAKKLYKISHYHPLPDSDDGEISSSDLCREITEARERGEPYNETDTEDFYYLSVAESTRPAVTGFSLSVYTLGSGLREDSDGPSTLVGASFAVSLRKALWGGLHPLSANYRFGIGHGEWGGRASTIFDLSVGYPLAFTHEGLLTHEVVVGVLGAARKSAVEPSPYLGYRLGAEIERVIVFLQLGKTWLGQNNPSLSAGLSFGFGARGGGPIRVVDQRRTRR